MLPMKSPQEVLALIEAEFAPTAPTEFIPLGLATGRTLAEDISATEYVPDFQRSCMDGYAVRSEDTVGCSEAAPARLVQQAEVLMGQVAEFALQPAACVAVPTGGAIPMGTDSVVMVEDTRDYGDGTIGITRPALPGENMVFRGEDVFPGKVILKKGRVLFAQDIGALAAIGRTRVPVAKKLTVGILSTGDELVPPEATPGPGQVRDVNSLMLQSMLTAFGAEVIHYGIVIDDDALLREKATAAAAQCDAVLISGGSSVGVKDSTCRIIESMGSILLHGISIKPGKPTILGKAGSKPLVGLPGHPVSAYFITKLFVLPLLARLTGKTTETYTVTARLTESVPANHVRTQYHCCCLEYREGQLYAHPIRGKSGLITALAGSNGYFYIPRDIEGFREGDEIRVTLTQ